MSLTDKQRAHIATITEATHTLELILARILVDQYVALPAVEFLRQAKDYVIVCVETGHGTGDL